MLLTTFRKDGTPVATPVWVVRIADELHVWTNPRTGKYKRIKRNPRVTLAPSSFRGDPRGDAVEGTARVLTAVEVEQLAAGIRRKYGWIGRLSMWSSVIGIKLRGWDPWGGLAITLSSRE